MITQEGVRNVFRCFSMSSRFAAMSMGVGTQTKIEATSRNRRVALRGCPWLTVPGLGAEARRLDDASARWSKDRTSPWRSSSTWISGTSARASSGGTTSESTSSSWGRPPGRLPTYGKCSTRRRGSTPSTRPTTSWTIPRPGPRRCAGVVRTAVRERRHAHEADITSAWDGTLVRAYRTPYSREAFRRAHVPTEAIGSSTVRRTRAHRAMAAVKLPLQVEVVT
jgi:hypothetical protein